jgi:crotonobetainyl-CoA:carnitine CoA-transferase CaiB-like acyl-CoA transferase
VREAVEEWIQARTADEVERAFSASQAVVGRVFSMDMIWNDESYRERENIVTVDDDGAAIAMHGVIPHVLGRPGAIRWPGPALGAHTEEVLGEWLGIAGQELADLRSDGVI